MKWSLAALLTGLLFFSLGTNTYKKGNVGEVGSTGVVFTENGESITNGTDSEFEFRIDEAGTVVLIAYDSGGDAPIVVRASGAETSELGHTFGTNVILRSDGGVVTVDGWITARRKVISLSSGALTANNVHLATAAGEYDIPNTFCNETIDLGNWITVILEDPEVLIEITLDDTDNKFWVAGLSIDVAHELHTVSSGSLPGDHVTLVCMVIDAIYSTSMSYQADGSIGWADGGA